MMRKLPGFLVMSLLISTLTLAQDDEIRSRRQPDMEGMPRWYFGGNFGLTFGDFTFVNISPQAGYRFTPMFSAGGGVNFIMQSNKIYYTGGGTEKSQYGYAGVNVFGRVHPLRFLILNLQPELNYVWGKTTYPGGIEIKQEGKIIPSVLLGGGLVIPTGARGNMIAMLQYDVIQDPLSPYGRNMFFSFGFNF